MDDVRIGTSCRVTLTTIDTDAYGRWRYCNASGDNPMISRRYVISFLVYGYLLFGIQGHAYSDELKIFTSRAVATVLEKIGPEFEKSTGHKLSIAIGLSSEFVGRINAGEAFDVVAAPPPVLDGLINNGKVAAESKTGLVRSANGVAVRKGAPKPDISSLENFKRALLDAKSITYLPVPGVPQIIERLGLKDMLAAKTTIPKTDLSSELVAKGDVELAIVPITQTFTTPGVELAGPLPPEVQFYTTFSGAISVATKSRDAAADLLKFFKGSSALRVVKEQGMEPI